MADPRRERANAQMLAALPDSAAKLAVRLELSQATVSRRLQLLFDSKLAHIGSWRRTRAKFEAVWVAGPGDHVACDLLPVRKDSRSPTWRAEARRDPLDGWDAEQARKLAEIKVRRDPLVAAFYGPGPGGGAAP